jgi:PBP1b-binding outer membrane lipoprotein LpoB
MTTLRRLSAVAALACALGGCAQSAPRHADSVLQKEQNAVAPLKDKYKDVITGIDVKDRTLTLYVEPNAMYSMDEDAEAAMKSGALERWKKAWAAAHPHQHGTVRLVVRDYFGREISTATASV